MSQEKRGLSRLSLLFRWLPEGVKDAVYLRFHNPAPKRSRYRPGQCPDGVNLFGYLSAPLGLGQGARLYEKALEQIALPLARVDVSPLLQKDVPEVSLAPENAPYAVHLLHLNPDTLPALWQAAPPALWAGHYHIGVWLWELERIPKNWRPMMKFFDEFWAPSRFIGEALRRDTCAPVSYMPYGIKTPVREGLSRADFGLPKDAFVVLCMFDVRSVLSRKNPQASVEAFLRAFPEEADVLLLIKTHGATEVECAHIRALAGGDSRLLLLNEDLEKPRLNALISLCDALISLHRSEGFGLILAEAMCLGVPVVATGWSANTDFMDETCACMVQYTLVPTGGAYVEPASDQRWAEPDTCHAADFLRRLYADPAYRTHIGQSGQARIQKDFSINACAARMRDRLEKIT